MHEVDFTVAEAFGVKPIFRFLPNSKLVAPALATGIEIEVEGWKDDDPSVYIGGLKKNGINAYWQSVKDESLKDHGREFTAGPICGDDFVQAVTDFCADAERRKFKISQRTGLHIHLDCTSNKGPRFLGNLVSAYMAVEHLLYSYCGEWRRWCGFCHSFYDATLHIPNLRKVFTATNKKDFSEAVKQIGRYSGLNLLSLTKFGTVEFRLLQTTFSPDEILLWANMCQSIYTAADKLTKDRDTIFNLFKKHGAVGVGSFVLGNTLPSVWQSVKHHFREDEFKKAVHRIRTLGLDPFGGQLFPKDGSTAMGNTTNKYFDFNFSIFKTKLKDLEELDEHSNEVLEEFLKGLSKSPKAKSLVGKKPSPKKSKFGSPFPQYVASISAGVTEATWTPANNAYSPDTDWDA